MVTVLAGDDESGPIDRLVRKILSARARSYTAGNGYGRGLIHFVILDLALVNESAIRFLESVQ